MKAYSSHWNKEDSSPAKTFVAGSVYGGLIFALAISSMPQLAPDSGGRRPQMARYPALLTPASRRIAVFDGHCGAADRSAELQS